MSLCVKSNAEYLEHALEVIVGEERDSDFASILG